jgi:hypothetical protein
MDKNKIKRCLREKEKKQHSTKYYNHDQEQIYIAITRFNENTWMENSLYREKHHIKGCLYGSPNELTHSIPINACVYVLEMNNATNEIMGIGKITNSFNYKTHRQHVYKIYKDRNYSRFVYMGDKRIDKSEFTKELKIICWYLECRLFYGYGPLDRPIRGTHFKRGMGINRLPIPLLKKYNERTFYLDMQIKYYFDNYFM